MEAVNITCEDTNINWYTQPLIDDITRDIIVDVLFVGAGICVSLFGVCTNIINIVVYMKQGIKDSVTVQFLALSVSDCVFSVLVFASSVSVVIGQVMPNLTIVDPLSLSYCLAQAREKAFSMSIMIIFIMSLERCFSVALPFQVKLIFTKSRSIKTLFCTAIIFLSLVIPEYLTQGLAWTYDVRFNSTRFMLWYSSDRSKFEVFKNSILAGLLPVLTGITSTLSALYIISAIKSSNKFRQSTLPDTHQGSSSETTKFNRSSKPSEAKTNISGKDVKLARTVVIVDIIFALCNIPKCIVLAISFVNLYIPEFSIFLPGKYKNILLVLMTITYIFEAINGACTFLVYYASSTKFRKAFENI